jgi:hypothetical protein
MIGHLRCKLALENRGRAKIHQAMKNRAPPADRDARNRVQAGRMHGPLRPMSLPVLKACR